MMPKSNWKITRLLAAVQDCAVSGADLWQHEANRHFDMALGLAEARRQGLLSGTTTRPALTRAGWAQAKAAAATLAPLTAALAMRAAAERADRMMSRHAAAIRAAELRVGRDD